MDEAGGHHILQTLEEACRVYEAAEKAGVNIEIGHYARLRRAMAMHVTDREISESYKEAMFAFKEERDAALSELSRSRSPDMTGS